MRGLFSGYLVLKADCEIELNNIDSSILPGTI